MKSIERAEVLKALDAVWQNPGTGKRNAGNRVDWLSMEQMLADILGNTQLTPDAKLAAAKECLDAFTRRGHFPPSEYLEHYSEARLNPEGGLKQ